MLWACKVFLLIVVALLALAGHSPGCASYR